MITRRAHPIPFATNMLGEAEATCREGLLATPDSVGLLHLAGQLAAKASQWSLAIARLSRAVALAPDDVRYRLDLGNALLSGGRPADALDQFRLVVAREPDEPRAHRGAGRALTRLGRWDEAHEALREATRLAPQHGPTHGDRGDLHAAQREWTAAIDAYTSWLAIVPGAAKAYVKIGDAHLALGALDDADAAFRAALARNRRVAPAHTGRGVVALRRGAFADALAHFRMAIAADPNDLAACHWFTQAADLLQQGSEASQGWYRLGVALQARQRYDDAVSAVRQSLASGPARLSMHIRLGELYSATGRAAEALQAYEAALAIAPDNRLAHGGAGFAAHAQGDLRRGWRELEWYQRAYREEARDFEQDVWDGSPLDGRTILVWTDWALGDSIQFARYVSLVTSCGGRVVLECHKELVPLFSRIPGVACVVAKSCPLPPFDVHGPLASLPRVFDTTLDSLPRAVPYLSVDPALVARWRETLGDGHALNVGLLWAGEPSRPAGRDRFTSLSTFAPLARVGGVRFISLQQGQQSLEVITPPDGLLCERFANDTRTLADTAALISNLDLVISVDTMIAHLSGALACPVWTLLAAGPDGRWGFEGESTPWYPTMRCFRQPRAGDWHEPMERIATSLSQLAQHRS